MANEKGKAVICGIVGGKQVCVPVAAEVAMTGTQKGNCCSNPGLCAVWENCFVDTTNGGCSCGSIVEVGWVEKLPVIR